MGEDADMEEGEYWDCVEPGEYCEVIAAPLVQIFSVWVEPNCVDGRPSEIYGSIRATEGSVTNLLYSLEEDESETINEFGKLSLIDSPPILGYEGVALDVCLKDRTKGIQLIKQQHYLDFSAEDVDHTYDILKRVALGKEGNMAYLYYIAFQFAVFAKVQVTVIKKGNEGNFTNVYDSIVASYSNNRKYCKTDDELKYLETHLFDKSSDEAVLTTGGTCIALSRSVVAVPAYSYLVIKVDLFESEVQFASNTLKFPAHDGAPATKLIESEIGCVKVDVQWMDPYLYMHKERKSVIANKRGATEPANKVQRVLDSSRNHNWDVAEWVEVFSVCIGGIKHDVFALSGTMEVWNYYPSQCMFNRDRNDPEVLPDDKVLYIESLFPLPESHLDVGLKLYDPINNLEVSSGCMCWSEQRLILGPIDWTGKRLCSVVRGADGYAAVHCMLLRSAVKAIVEATFFCDGSSADSSFSSVYGAVFAWYGGGHPFSISTNYEKKYYRSRLFCKPRDKPMNLSSGSRIPLSKSAVAVPRKSSLIIGVDLKMIRGGNPEEDGVCGDLEFMIDLSSEVCKEIHIGSYRIMLSVKFTDDRTSEYN